MEAFYEQGMFTGGLSTIQTDELHSYEEGIQVLGQSLLLDYGDPKQLERAMETSRALVGLTGVNGAGHRHIRSTYFSGSKMATEEPWGWSKPHSVLVFHPALMLVRFNGNPLMKKVVAELADGLLAHRKQAEGGRYSISGAIRFSDDADMPWARGSYLPLLWGAYRLTGDNKYLQPFWDEGARGLESIPSNALDLLKVREKLGKDIVDAVKPREGNGRPSPPPTYAAQHLAWQLTGEKRHLEALYAAQIEASALREFINTEGSLWIDRVAVPTAELQRARLGGVALVRNSLYPGNAVSWKFAAPGDDERAAILIPDATPDALKVVVYNLSGSPVGAEMTAWDLEPGRWQVTQGVDADGDDAADGETLTSTVELERSNGIALTFAPRAATVLTLRLVERGSPVWSRPDLGIGHDDVSVRGRKVTVTVHSLGAADTRPATLALVDAGGKVLSTAALPALKAPADLLPKRVTLTLNVPAGARLEGASVRIDPDPSLKEITLVNNRVKL